MSVLAGKRPRGVVGKVSVGNQRKVGTVGGVKHDGRRRGRKGGERC